MTKARSKPDRNPRRAEAPRSAGATPVKEKTPRYLLSGKVLDLVAHVTVPVVFFLFVWFWHPFHAVFEFDPDEGNNVIKALMLAKGHALYAEIWSDQPPLFTYLLRGWFALTSWTVPQGRVLVLLCATVLLWAVYQTVRLSWGHPAALVSAFLLITSYRYLALSVSVMLALPTLMFAMLSIYALARYRRAPHAGWLMASGVLLVFALFTKLFALLMAPLLFLAVLHTAWSKQKQPPPNRRWFLPVGLWCGSMVVAGAVLFLLTIPPGELVQLLQPHLDAKREMSSAGFAEVFSGMVKADYAFALLGLVGLLQILRKRDWFSLLPVVWCMLAYVSLYMHRPLWYHHYPLLGVPLCWTAGMGAGALFSRELWRAWLPWRGLPSAYALLTVLPALGFGILAATQIPAKFQRELDYARPYTALTTGDLYTVAVLKQFKDRTDYAVTDRQMLAFSASMIVPPELSVTSVKRMRSGHLTMEALVRLLERYEPGVIHLSWRNRIPMTPELKDYLQAQYALLYADPRGDRCYVRKTLGADPLAVLERAAAEVPRSWEGHYNLGMRLKGMQREEDAARALQEAARLRAAGRS